MTIESYFVDTVIASANYRPVVVYSEDDYEAYFINGISHAIHDDVLQLAVL